LNPIFPLQFPPFTPSPLVLARSSSPATPYPLLPPPQSKIVRTRQRQKHPSLSSRLPFSKRSVVPSLGRSFSLVQSFSPRTFYIAIKHSHCRCLKIFRSMGRHLGGSLSWHPLLFFLYLRPLPFFPSHLQVFRCSFHPPLRRLVSKPNHFFCPRRPLSSPQRTRSFFSCPDASRSQEDRPCVVRFCPSFHTALNGRPFLGSFFFVCLTHLHQESLSSRVRSSLAAILESFPPLDRRPACSNR